MYLILIANKTNKKSINNKNSLYNKSRVRYEVFTAVTMKNAVFWDITPCGSCKNWHFRGMYCLHYHNGLQLLVTAGIIPSSLILAILMMVIRSSKTSVLTRTTRRTISEDGTLQQRWDFLLNFQWTLIMQHPLLGSRDLEFTAVEEESVVDKVVCAYSMLYRQNF
jgi:hypothetical protein